MASSSSSHSSPSHHSSLSSSSAIKRTSKTLRKPVISSSFSKLVSLISCCVCGELDSNPQQFSGCDKHFLCNTCAAEKSVCPKCGVDGNKGSSSLGLSLVEALVCRCHECNWNGPYSEYEAHLEACVWIYNCGCGLKMQQGQALVHSFSCPLMSRLNNIKKDSTNISIPFREREVISGKSQLSDLITESKAMISYLSVHETSYGSIHVKEKNILPKPGYLEAQKEMCRPPNGLSADTSSSLTKKMHSLKEMYELIGHGLEAEHGKLTFNIFSWKLKLNGVSENWCSSQTTSVFGLSDDSITLTSNPKISKRLFIRGDISVHSICHGYKGSESVSKVTLCIIPINEYGSEYKSLDYVIEETSHKFNHFNSRISSETFRVTVMSTLLVLKMSREDADFINNEVSHLCSCETVTEIDDTYHSE